MIYLIGAILLAVIQVAVLWWFGQPIISASGQIMLWQGEIMNPENSQQIADWYTFSHFIHGVIFFWFFTWLFPRWSVMQRLFAAVAVEVSWEIFENTPWLIEKYREQALAQGYFGDSILNSFCDTVAMAAGFFFASRNRFFWCVIVCVALELFVGYYIRDGLALNILNFIVPLDSVHSWQSGAN